MAPVPGGGPAGPAGPSRRHAGRASRGPSRGERLWYGFARGVVELACRLTWRIQIVGAARVPASGPFVLAPVHRSNIDTLLAACVTRRRVRFMAKDGVWKYRAVGAFLGSLGGFPVHRGVPDREAMRTCEDALRAGEPVVLFPEGSRRSGPVVEPLFDGAAFVAARAGAPIVPVAIGGSEWAMRKGSAMIRPVKVVLVVGQPIVVPPSPGGRVSRRQVAETTAQLHQELQHLFDEALRRAGRAGPGWSR